MTIGNLTELNFLNLSVNKLEELPLTIGNLTGLKFLNLSVNKLEELPYSIGNLTGLNFLNLSHNKLEELPSSIGELTQLGPVLNINDNKLKVLPPNIGNLTQLKNFNLSVNKLEILPYNIGNLYELDNLDVSYNQLENLPDSIETLTRLQKLNLDNNHLMNIQDNIRNLPLLTNLTFENNPVSIVPTQPDAMEVHDASKPIFSTQNISSLNAFFNKKVENPTQGDSNIKKFIKDYIHKFLEELSANKKTIPHHKKPNYYDYNQRTLTTWNEVWNVLYQDRIELIVVNNIFNEEQQRTLRLSLLYVDKQPLEFKQTYVIEFINESITAYEYDNFRQNFSCSRGVLERLILSINSAITFLISKNNLTRDKIDEYNELGKFLKTIDLNMATKKINDWMSSNKGFIGSNTNKRNINIINQKKNC